MFSIDERSGNITTAGHVDFASSSQIRLVVLAKDGGANSFPSSTTVTVRASDVNRHPPQLQIHSPGGSTDLLHFTVPENSPPDTFVAHVIASDPDFGDAGRVACHPDTGSPYFHLVPLFPDSGSGWQRSVEYKLVSSVVLDREIRDVYQFRLECRDFGDPVGVVSVLVDVEVTDVDDHRPVFTAAVYNFSVHENNRRGQVSIGLKAVTRGAGDILYV